MIVIVKSGPDTADGSRGVKFARDMAADLVLLQNGVHFALKERLSGFCGSAFVLAEDRRLRGVAEADLERGIKEIGYDELVDYLAAADKVVGMF